MNIHRDQNRKIKAALAYQRIIWNLPYSGRDILEPAGV